MRTILGLFVIVFTSCVSAPVQPLTRARAQAIAERTVAAREHWPTGKTPDGITHTVVCQLSPTGQGGWNVTAHQALVDTLGAVGFVPGSGRHLVITPASHISGYTKVEP